MHGQRAGTVTRGAEGFPRGAARDGAATATDNGSSAASGPRAVTTTGAGEGRARADQGTHAA